jgi:hypothetical protein
MKTYFICGRATTNFVPVNTRLARKTSSTPGVDVIKLDFFIADDKVK